ncbi:MAG: AMP-binding protein [Acidobacteria bacterium]|nr:AMP-binding protein [Acidobacteriota bacterium]MBV9475488.1 AMP-binding protein [Acidobacteriota bacterium]
MPDAERRALESFVVSLPAHVWLATSGTSGALKLTALSKRALLASAAAVNRHLESDARDVWCCVLPTFHVGGLGIYARAYLSGARVIAATWDAGAFASMDEITLASLVPAQVRDLVEAGLRAPRGLRAIVVGGGAFSDDLYDGARELGWPVLPSYGMTECCSQVATATLASPELVLLRHVEARVEAGGRLALRSESLLTGYATEAGFTDPKRDGWFLTEDRGSVDGCVLHIAGRAGEFIKIGGESVDLSRLDRIVAGLAGDGAAVVAVPDARLGFVIHLAVETRLDWAAIVRDYDARVHPFERARRVHQVAEIPRTPLGKLKRAALVAMLRESLE